MNTGIQDIINLGWKLAMVYKGIAKSALLDNYSSERIPIINSLVNTTESGTDLFDSDSPLERTLLVHALPWAVSLKSLRKRGSEFASELTVDYRESTLNCSSKALGSLRPGDRVPDLTVTTEVSGASLLSLLDPTRFTLLSIGEPSDDDAFAPLERDWKSQRISSPSEGPHATVFSRVFGKARWLLVRPDGYLIGAPTVEETARLQTWQSTWLL